jgi:N-acyl homoserine lactone hydrolase
MIAAALALALAAPVPEVTLVRIDCGTIVSDAPVAQGGWDFTNSCYLVRHGDDYLLWDTGVNGAIEGKPFHDGRQTISVPERIVPQLARIGVKPEQVRWVGISHLHGDHTGQALDFPNATLLLGREDFDLLKASESVPQRRGTLPWLAGERKAEPLEGDRDLFGDGSVVLLDLPGHTPGHYGLLVKTRDRTVLLSGDQFHQRSQYESGDVPGNATDVAQAKASGARFKALAAEHKAVVVIQHDRTDIPLIPTIPERAP